MTGVESSELACPTCGSPMVRRRRRSDGAEFWGCPRYPQCRGTRDLEAISAVRPHQPSALIDAVRWDDPSWHKTEAGASARARYRKGRDRHAARTQRRRPMILAQGSVIGMAGIFLASGGLGASWKLYGLLMVAFAVLFVLTSLFVLPNHIRAWNIGADGEVRTAQLLEPLAREGFIVLHDRRMRGGRENVDHLVIGPPGVFVVETKNYGGSLGVRRGELYVAGRRRTGVIDQVTRQAAGVGEALGGVPVGRVIVVHRADFPLFGQPKIDGVPIVKPRDLVRLFRSLPTAMDGSEVRRLADLAAIQLPAA